MPNVVLTSIHDNLVDYVVAHGLNPNVVIPLIDQAAAEAIAGWRVTGVSVTYAESADPYEAEATTRQLVAEVQGTGEYTQNVAWSISGSISPLTVIDDDGLLTVDAGEFVDVDKNNLAEHIITITATSVDNQAISGTAPFTCLTGYYSVLYDANGGTGTMIDVSSPYEEDDTVTVLSNSFTKANNVFSKWNTAANGSGTDRAPSDDFVITSNVVLYAIWIPTYTVTYNNNGGVGTMADEDSPYNRGATVTVAANTFTKANFEFVEWNTASDGSGTTYDPADEIEIAGNMTFYAVWAPTYNVTYNANGGATTMTDATDYSVGDTVTVLTNTFTYANKVFSHFNTLANGNGLSYTNPDTFVISADTTLYAIWNDQYSVTYDTNTGDGGTAPAGNGTYYNSAAAVTVEANAFTKTNYTFLYWNTLANGTGVSYIASDIFNIVANTVLYAIWQAKYTLSYNAGTGGAGTAPASDGGYHSVGDTIILPGNDGPFTKADSDFWHWNTATNDGGTTYLPAASFTMPAANTTLYAIWTGAIDTLTISEATAHSLTITGVDTLQFICAVTGTGAYLRDVVWSISGNTNTVGTFISNNGFLVISATEVTGDDHNITVTATSVINSSKTDTETVIIDVP